MLATVGLGAILQAFLPQFVPASAQQPTLSVFVLGTAFAVLTFLIKGPVGILAGALSGWLRSRPGVLTWVYRSSGAILIIEQLGSTQSANIREAAALAKSRKYRKWQPL